MKKTLPQYFNEERKRVIEKCIQCGLCIKKCPIIKHTELAKVSSKDIQKEVIKFLQTGKSNEIVFTRAFSCMECFGCIDNFCPQELNPMLINEIIKWDYQRNNLIENLNTNIKDDDFPQRVFASIQISSTEFGKIFTPTKKDAKYVFFPGCNVYFQPEKILNALDILNLITKDYAFVPGVDFCCGDIHFFSGEVEKAEKAYKKLINKLFSYDPETVIFWCPTCQCRLESTISNIENIPFNIVSFPQFLAQNMDKLSFKKRIPKTVTLHEPCKSAYTGIDLTSMRDVLRDIPGIDLVEMPRHGKKTSCCGSGSAAFFSRSLENVRDERLKEVAQTNADILVDVCHYCHEVFVPEESKNNYSIINYISLIAEALGIEREDKFKKYKQWCNIDKIMNDAKLFIKSSPYSREKIIEVLKKL